VHIGQRGGSPCHGNMTKRIVPWFTKTQENDLKTYNLELRTWNYKETLVILSRIRRYKMENKKSKREAIIYSALKMFERDGFHKTKVEEIAKGANVGKGTIYEYFDSKKDLFCQMVKYMMDKYIDIMKEAVEEEVDAVTKLHNLLKLQLKLTDAHGSIGHMIQVQVIKSGVGEQLKPMFIEFRRKQIDVIEEVIKDGIEAGLFKSADTYMAALFFIGGSNQFAFEKSFMANFCDEYKSEIKLDARGFIDAFLMGIKK
jgi:TetR/AcrR family fatty acid metabolism transcriptional regulator